MPGDQFTSAGKRFKEVTCTFFICFSSQSNDKVAWRIIEKTVLSAVLWSANNGCLKISGTCQDMQIFHCLYNSVLTVM